jgi:hypothetical protein
MSFILHELLLRYGDVNDLFLRIKKFVPMVIGAGRASHCTAAYYPRNRAEDVLFVEKM